ncbi:IS4 family transposase [bacterium]|nr:MAG: IS4 family transposase [bacterium]
MSDTKRACFADARLRSRLALMTGKLAAAPSKSFPNVFTSAELEAAYRFFGNPLVTPDGVLSAHFERTRMGAEREPTVLIVHDSSTFAFEPDGARRGLGRVRKVGQAFFAHVSLVLSDDGTRRPLGVAALTTWVRETKTASGHEKARWWAAVERASERLGKAARPLHIMDREADDYALFARMTEAGHRFVVRSAHDRLLEGWTAKSPAKLRHAAARIECAVPREAKLSKRTDRARSPQQKAIHPTRGTRTAKLSIGAASVALLRPETQDKALAPHLTLNLVRVWEAEPPVGERPIEWLLLTTEPVDHVDALLRVVDRYRARWTIEEFFKALKTGCAFSERQLGDYEGLVNALAVFVPIACRLLALRTHASHEPDAPATRTLEADEIHVLRALGRRPLSVAPSTREALLAVAALGGHIQWSGEPGWLTISRGFTELLALTRGWRAAKLPPSCDQG